MPRKSRRFRIAPSLMAAAFLTCAAVVPGSAAVQKPKSDAAYQLEMLRDGYGLTRLEADGLEAVLRANPDDIAARARLLGYYAGPALGHRPASEIVAARRQHILWLIEHHAGSALAGSAEVAIDARGHVLADGKGHEQARAKWLVHVDDSAATPAVIRNAVNFLQFSDRFLAEAVLLKARRDDPANRAWTRDLARLYALGLLRIGGFTPRGAPSGIDFSDAGVDFSRKARHLLESSTDAPLLAAAGPQIVQYGIAIREARVDGFGPEAQRVAERILVHGQLWPSLARLYLFQRDQAPNGAARRAAAKQALDAYERQFAATADPRDRFRVLAGERLAELALEAGANNVAEWIAKEMLRLAPDNRGDVLYGDGVFHAYIALGRLALANGDRETAARHLLDAGHTPGSLSLAEAGPSMRLAYDLLNAGERAAVVEYLELCKQFWEQGRREQLLDRWIAAIRAGRMPDFGRLLGT